jgi:serine/threonine protein kinase
LTEDQFRGHTLPHENGIVHCDVTPPNILVRSLNPPELVLTDFGISSLLTSDLSNKMTSGKFDPKGPQVCGKKLSKNVVIWPQYEGLSGLRAISPHADAGGIFDFRVTLRCSHSCRSRRERSKTVFCWALRF